MHIKQFLVIGIVILIICMEICRKGQLTQKKQFEGWAQVYNKRYGNEMEKYYRYMIFAENSQMVLEHNQKYERGNSKYRMALSFYSDLLEDEYSFRIQSKNSKNLNITLKCSGIILDTPNPPDVINWIEKKTVQEKLPIQYSGCPSSWAFSAVAAVSGLYKIKKGALQIMSVPQIIQCSGPYGNEECSGGYMEQAYWYIVDNGIALNSTYRFNDIKEKCHYLTSQKFAGIGRCASVPSGSYYKLLSAVVQQPVTAAISFPKEMVHYESGIFDEEECNPDVHLDQGVLIIGYGEQEQGKYWDVLYSRKFQSESGRIKILRTEEDGPGKCGIQLAASVPQNVS